MTNLIDKQEVTNLLKKRNSTSLINANALMNILKMNELNKLYNVLIENGQETFFDKAIEELGIRYEIEGKGLSNIPKKGPFICVANHPYGGIDGILLLKTILSVRDDFKIFGNFLLQKIEPLKDYVFPVNPFEQSPTSNKSLAGIRKALGHLQNNGPLGIFPAGEVSSYNKEFNRITDKKWETGILKFIKKANVPVVTVYFSGTNSFIFHALGLLHPTLRTAKLPSELFNKKDKLIKISIGKEIPTDVQDEFSDIEQYGRFLRANTYLPENTFRVKRFFLRPMALPMKKQEKVIKPVNCYDLQNEIDRIDPEHKLAELGNMRVFCVPTALIPNIMIELGRLRELTFREVGEGTNKQIDIDEYDLYYHQLFIWDADRQTIVGAYRIGLGKKIMRENGVKGFYTRSLFKYKKKFIPVLENSLELGRSFIVKDYQKKPMSLFLLWKGILLFLLKNPEYRYLLGPVSISNQYSKLSRKLMIAFMKSNYYHAEYAKLIKPRKKFRVNLNKITDAELLISTMKGDLRKLDNALSHIESEYVSVPILLKKYLKQNGKILGFNRDPKFNNCLDGLLLLDSLDIPRATIESLARESKDMQTNNQVDANGVIV